MLANKLLLLAARRMVKQINEEQGQAFHNSKHKEFEQKGRAEDFPFIECTNDKT